MNEQPIRLEITLHPTNPTQVWRARLKRSDTNEQLSFPNLRELTRYLEHLEPPPAQPSGLR
jgi:hypothetical protein